MLFLLIALTASVGFGQTTRGIQLTQDQNRQDMEQIAVVLRAVAGISQVSVDDTRRIVTIQGADAQLAMAAWLIQQMDLPEAGPFSGVHEYQPSAAVDDVLRVFYLTRASTPQHLQEIVTSVRSVADIRRLFVYGPIHAVAARGTHPQMSLAAWLVDQLNQPAGASAPAPHEYQLPGDDVARVFELTHPRTPRDLQEITTLIRAIADVPRVLACQERRAVALRASSERIALAAWLVCELDKPLDGHVAAEDRAARHEYHFPSGPDNLVRIFYLAGSRSPEEQQEVAAHVRATVRVPRLFIYNALGALAVRGTVGQVASAERLLEEMKAL